MIITTVMFLASATATLLRAFEMAGLDLESASPPTGKHFLLRPVGLRLYVMKDNPNPRPGMADEYIAEFTDDLYSADGWEWDKIELEEREPAVTRRSLWDFVGIIGRPLGEISRFIEKWGLLDYGEDVTWGDLKQGGSITKDEWLQHIFEVQTVLLTLSSTEARELVPPDELLFLRDYDEEPFDYSSERARDLTPDDMSARRKRRLVERWRQYQIAGFGLQLQRRLVTGALTDWLRYLDSRPHWDETGRRLATVAHGVKAIIAAHLQSIFTAPTLDVFVCSICGKPFQLEVVGTARRPRAGTRRYCSDECRKEGKRKANLESWHRNKTRWVRKGGTDG